MFRIGDLIVCAYSEEAWCLGNYAGTVGGRIHATVTNPLNAPARVGDLVSVLPGFARAAQGENDVMPVDVHRKLRGHRFYPTMAQLAKLPDLYSQDAAPVEDSTVHYRYFAPWGTWWITEFGRGSDAGQAYGYTRLADAPGMAEWGTIWLPDIERHVATTTLRSPSGRPIAAIPLLAERDLYFRPGKARDVIPDLANNAQGAE